MDILEEESIETVKDLNLQISDEKTWAEITASWPKALPKRIEAKLAELDAQAGESRGVGKQAYPFVHKECWIFYEPEYETLRSAPGNESLGDLPQTINDVAEAKRIALGLGVAEQNIKQFTKMSANSIQ